MNTADLFAKFGKTTLGHGEEYIPEGDHILTVERLKQVVSVRPETEGNLMLIFSFTVKTSTVPGLAGKTVSIARNITKHPFALKDFKRIVVAICRVGDPTIGEASKTPAEWSALLESLMTEGSMNADGSRGEPGTLAAGVDLRCAAKASERKNKAGIVQRFTDYSWTPAVPA
jgi:hypothetical protein